MLARCGHGWVGRFAAMASPCEVHVAGADRAIAHRVASAVAAEAWRVEHKLSRYRDDNVIATINSACGRAVRVDEEIARLLSYARELYLLSGGLFDITSGVLRRAWRFDGSDHVPSRRTVEALMGRIGWHRVRFEPPEIEMPPGMELDFGGIGKEYAVDRAGLLARPLWPHCLINFGGDLLAIGPRADGRPWLVGVEHPDAPDLAAHRIELTAGALATSGDARRFLLHRGKRYGHVLDPRTGWPVRGAPRSVTTAAPTCTEAGMLATFALLHGGGAERFLDAQGVRYWCRR